jgi:parvulin-like peptidyl-prolyl isomerase
MKDSNASAAPGRGAGRTSRTVIVVAVVSFMVVVVGVAGLLIYRDQFARSRATLIEIDGQVTVKMAYFLKRAALLREEPLDLMQKIIEEEVIKQVAVRPPYNLVVSDEEIDAVLRSGARGESESISDSEFKEWYRQQLNDSRLSDPEFRDLVLTNLLRQRLTEYVGERVPTIAPQVRALLINVADGLEAQRTKLRLDAGESFSQLASEVNGDDELKRRGGDMGWRPRAALPLDVDHVAFEQLEVGQYSDVFGLADGTFAIVFLVDRVEAREIDAAGMRSVRNSALDDWLREELPRHDLEIHGFTNGYDRETDAWVRWQVERLQG